MYTNIPEEILIEIFSRLPTKSIGKFRCLSKPWRALLSTPSFIKSHLTRKTHQQNLILIYPLYCNTVLTILTINDDYEAVSKNFDLSNTWRAVVGSCNGLVLLVNKEDDLYLVNPITKKHVSIPDSPLALPREESLRIHGFGCDSSSGDYKIVTLSYYDTELVYGPTYVGSFSDVYSMKWGVWKRVNNSSYDHVVFHRGAGAFVNGVIHWLASSEESDYLSVIVAFDIVEDVFYEIPAPPSVHKITFVFNKLVVLGKSLCMVDTRSSSPELWMLKEYGKVESWTKFSIDVELEFIKPLCLIGDDEVVLLTEEGSLVVYNVKEGYSKNMVVHGVGVMSFDGSTFRDSLVSPAFGDNLL